MSQTLTKNRRGILARASIRKQVAALSTGVYYDNFQQWATLLAQVCQQHGLKVFGGVDTPHNHTGCGIAYLVEDVESPERGVGQIWFSYYRMPSSRWEIVCYIA